MYNINNIIRYIVQALAIYLLLSSLPLITSDKSLHITTQNIIIITVLLMLIFIIFENLCSNNTFTNTNKLKYNQKPNNCKNICSKTETFENSTNPNKKDENSENDYQGGGIGNDNTDNETDGDTGNGDMGNGDMGNGDMGNGDMGNDNDNANTKPNIDREDMYIINRLQNKYGSLCNIKPDNSKPYQPNKPYQPTKPYQPKPKPNRPTDTVNCDDEEDDMAYDSNHDYNNLPVLKESNMRDYQDGYSYLPPKQWFPKNMRPPVCVTNQPATVYPVNTIGLPMDLKEWNSARKILPPDNINIKYIEKLNKGI